MSSATICLRASFTFCLSSFHLSSCLYLVNLARRGKGKNRCNFSFIYFHSCYTTFPHYCSQLLSNLAWSFPVLYVEMEVERQPFNWEMLNVSAFRSSCDFFFGGWYWTEFRWHLSDAFCSLEMHLSLKCKKIKCRFCFFGPPFPMLKISKSLMTESLVNTLGTRKISRHRKALWTVVVMVLMIFGCSLSALMKFESFLWPLSLGRSHRIGS